MSELISSKWTIEDRFQAIRKLADEMSMIKAERRFPTPDELSNWERRLRFLTVASFEFLQANREQVLGIKDDETNPLT